jgi:hypothetical protein
MVAGCNGGLKHGKARFGGVLSIGEQTMIKYCSTIPAIYGEMTSYRSELYGILSTLLVYQKIRDYVIAYKGGMVTSQLKIICDNKAAVDVINKIKMTSNLSYNIITVLMRTY